VLLCGAYNRQSAAATHLNRIDGACAIMQTILVRSPIAINLSRAGGLETGAVCWGAERRKKCDTLEDALEMGVENSCTGACERRAEFELVAHGKWMLSGAGILGAGKVVGRGALRFWGSWAHIMNPLWP
jgi:hypothetical protein